MKSQEASLAYVHPRAITGPASPTGHSFPKKQPLRLWQCHKNWLPTFTMEATVRSDTSIFIIQKEATERMLRLSPSYI